MRRSLIYFWRMNLAVVAGVAVTTAVLTGALLVGDSLRGSLQDLTFDRLGQIDRALLNNRLFPDNLVERLARHPRIEENNLLLAPAMLLQGSAVAPNTDRRASGVQVIGVDDRFAALYPNSSTSEQVDFVRIEGQIFPSTVVNAALLAELGAEVGDDLLLSFGRPAAVPSASLLGRREQQDVLTTFRVTISGVLPTSGPGRFGLEARQNRPMNAFVEIETLQKRLDRPGEINLMLVGQGVGSESQELDPELLNSVLQETLQVEDLGLRIRRGSAYLAIESSELVLRPRVAEGVLEAAKVSNLAAWPYLTYLANQMEVGERTLPYSTITALALPIPEGAGTLTVQTGIDISEMRSDQIALNSWTAEELGATPGDSVTLSYYVVGANDELGTGSKTFEVAAIVEMASLGADSTLTPDVPGISDAGDISGWDPPFPVDLDLVTTRDEDYWDAYKGAPKAFVTLETGQELWRSRYGDLTSIRLVPSADSDLDKVLEGLEQQLAGVLETETGGFQWLPVRSQGLQGASGTTDFAQLFLGFSLFLIVSAALLVGLLFALLVEHRGREVGLFLATGYTVKAVRRRFMQEGLLLAIVGILIGTGLAVLYTRAVLRGLTTWWAPVLDSPILRVHTSWQSLIVGALATLILVVLVIALTVRRISKMPAPQLLAGQVGQDPSVSRPSRAWIVATGALLFAVSLLAVSLVIGMESAPGLFFGVGASLVLAGIAGFAAWSRKPRQQAILGTSQVIARLAARNSSRNLGRSLLSITLVASASFVLVSVSASRKQHGLDESSQTSGTGGFTFIAEADTPLPMRLGQIDAASSLDGDVYSLRLLPGDDASCLNLYQPEKPRVLGVPDSFIERGGFQFRSTLSSSDNPWELLHQSFPDGAIPAIGDYNSVRWILHSGVGKDLYLEDDHGRKITLRVVGLLNTSIFQSELLISESRFLEHFPDHFGYGYFLGSPTSDQLESTLQSLESGVSDYGLDAESALTRLQDFQAVENMYLTTFEVLGGLGILLGTVGLGVVLLRNTLERRGELATLRAFGYRRSTLAWMVVAENAWLLSIGLIIGTVAGLIAVAPHLISGGISVPWASLAGILLAVFAVGLLSSTAAVLGSLRVPLLPALKAD